MNHWQLMACANLNLQCVAVYCSVLQRVAEFAVCDSVLQHTTVCCSLLQCAVVRGTVVQCALVCYNCVDEPLAADVKCQFEFAVCCGVLQCTAACCSVLQCFTTVSMNHRRLRRMPTLNLCCVAVCCSMVQYAAVCCTCSVSRSGEGPL